MAKNSSSSFQDMEQFNMMNTLFFTESTHFSINNFSVGINHLIEKLTEASLVESLQIKKHIGIRYLWIHQFKKK